MKRFLLLAFAMGWFTFAYTQPENMPAPVPLDGGLSLLVAGGAALGYRIYKKKQNSGE